VVFAMLAAAVTVIVLSHEAQSFLQLLVMRVERFLGL
jgi:hypothetical protein